MSTAITSPERLQLIGYQGEPSRVVDCFPTCSEHFVVTPETANFSTKPAWNLTHFKSAARVIGPFKSRAEVRLMAAIFAALPMPWDKFTSKVGERGDHEEKAIFNAAWLAMPQEIKDWRKAVNQACLEYLDSL